MSEQRDLRADLREWNSDLINGIRSTDWFYLVGEYIERAIKAEEELEMLENECDMCKNDKETLALETIADLRELNEKLSDDLVKTIEKCAPDHEE